MTRYNIGKQEKSGIPPRLKGLGNKRPQKVLIGEWGENWILSSIINIQKF